MREPVRFYAPRSRVQNYESRRMGASSFIGISARCLFVSHAALGIPFLRALFLSGSKFFTQRHSKFDLIWDCNKIFLLHNQLRLILIEFFII